MFFPHKIDVALMKRASFALCFLMRALGKILNFDQTPVGVVIPSVGSEFGQREENVAERLNKRCFVAYR
jgi:hypothetical protein